MLRCITIFLLVQDVLEAISLPQFRALLGLELSQTKIAKLLVLITQPSEDPITLQHVKYVVCVALNNTIVVHTDNACCSVAGW
jgi:hypothetical protein